MMMDCKFFPFRSLPLQLSSFTFVKLFAIRVQCPDLEDVLEDEGRGHPVFKRKEKEKRGVRMRWPVFFSTPASAL